MNAAKNRYFIYGFTFLWEVYKKKFSQFEFEYNDVDPKIESSVKQVRESFLRLRRLTKSGQLDQYDIVHINTWENFPNYVKRPGQLSICHSHGIHIGLDRKIGVSQSKPFVRFLLNLGPAFLLNMMLKKAIGRFDLCYVAIPNALPYAKKIRKDAMWMPNPIDTKLFTPMKVKRYPSPAILFPTRLHEVKNPEFAFRIFEEILKNFPNAKLHLIRYPQRYAHEKQYASLLKKFARHIVYHPFMKREELPSFYNKFDLILGAFNPNYYYANLNLIELEAMACKVPVVAHDKYEFIKKDLDELPSLAIRLLKDQKYAKRYAGDARTYVKKFHGEDAVCRVHQKNIQSFGIVKF